MRRLQWLPTQCADCDDFSPEAWGSRGRCRHADGPCRTVYSRTINAEYFYPVGCPRNPSPPAPRKRPQKKSATRSIEIRDDTPPERRPRRRTNGDWE